MADIRPGLVWVSLDCNNAFNTLQRSRVLDAVAARVPNLKAYAQFSLARRSRYWFQTADGEFVELAAEEGVDQGAPLSPALFSLGLAAPLARLETRLRDLARSRGLDPEEVLVIAYLDDLLLSLPPELVQEGLTLAQEELGTVGLTLNEAKTNAWAPQPPPPEVLTLLQVDDRW